MVQRKVQKRTIPRVLDDINNSINANEYSSNFDTLFCMFLSPILLIGALSIPFFGHYVLHRPALDLVIDTTIMFIFGISFELLLRVKIEQKIRHHLVSLFYSLTFLFSVLRFYPFAGPALWTFAFIQIILSLSQNSPVMLVHSAISVTIAVAYVSLFQAQANSSIHPYYIHTQFGLLILLYIIAKAIYTLNINHIKKSDKQLVLLREEMAERKMVEDKNIYLAMYDQLTGLPNRTLFCDRLNQAIEFSTRKKFELYVLFIDIDLFKLINDTLGHSSGDELLKKIGERLSGVLRSSDAVGRVSGDEFLIMLQNVEDDNYLYKVVQRVLERINTPFTINKHHVTVSCSIGISKFPDNGDNAENLIKYADIAMYKAKQDGKNRFAIYSKDLEQMRRDERETVDALQNALVNNEFRIYYQPQVNANTKEVIGFEALIRWQHPTRGLLLAGEVIPAAEKSGLIIPIGKWVLRTACRQNKQWQDNGMKPVPIAVNISMHQITSSSLYDLVREVLEETGLEPKYLELEITETILAKEMDDLNSNLTKIRDLGVKIAIDDFGMGYSAIHYLKLFPINRIKIPMDFIHGINNNTKDESIISVILGLAESLGIDVVAEGVETENQLEFLLDRYCSNIQGFYFSRPMPADDVEDFVREQI